MKCVPPKVPVYQELPTETSTKDFSCLNHTQKNAFKNKIVIFFFPLLEKKKIWYFHSLTRFWGEFLQKQSSTGKKNTFLLIRC